MLIGFIAILKAQYMRSKLSLLYFKACLIICLEFRNGEGAKRASNYKQCSMEIRDIYLYVCMYSFFVWYVHALVYQLP